MVMKTFVIHEEVIDIFHIYIYIPTISIFHFVYIMYSLLVHWNIVKLEMIVLVSTGRGGGGSFQLEKYYSEKYSEKLV